MTEDMKYQKVYQQLKKDIKEANTKRTQGIRDIEQLDKEIARLRELIQPFEKHFGPDDPASASIIETQLGI